MIIRGILDSSLNGQLCLRGFAPIKELSRISKADYNWQRDLHSELEEDIRDFLTKEPYLFFPEVILSYKIKHDLLKGKEANETPLQTIQLNKSYKSLVDGTHIKVRNVNYRSSQDVRGKNDILVVELDLADANLNAAIEANNHPFQRIDGNHRLTSAGNTDSPKVDKMVAPYCILLGQEFYNNGVLTQDPTTETFNKSVKVFFYNINTKSIPLTSEENLKVIIDDSVNFPDHELKEIMGLEGLKTRELIHKVNPAYFTGITHIVGEQFRTFYMDVFKRLLQRGEDENQIVDKVFESLKAIDQLYNSDAKLKANSSFGLLSAFLYYHTEENEAKFNFFKEWVLSNHLFEIQEVKAESIVKIFDKISERNITVFVAMPYYEGDPSIMESYNQAYKRVIERIKGTFQYINISLYRIMQYEGKTRDIIENMINEIKNCNIFIADITGGNANVGYELGIARGLRKPIVIVRQKEDTVKVPFDYEHDVRNPYNHKAISTLEDEVYKNIVAILASDFGFITDTNDSN